MGSAKTARVALNNKTLICFFIPALLLLFCDYCNACPRDTNPSSGKMLRSLYRDRIAGFSEVLATHTEPQSASFIFSDTVSRRATSDSRSLFHSLRGRRSSCRAPPLYAIPPARSRSEFGCVCLLCGHWHRVQLRIE